MKPLEGKASLITGGASGIGKAVAEEFLKRKIKVSIIDVNENGIKQTVKEFQSLYGEKEIIGFVCDVRDEKQFEKITLETKSTFGRLDILINNAGILDEDNYDLTIQINLIAVIRGTQLALRHLSNDKGEKGGMVINTASSVVLSSIPNIATYAASKHGVVAYTREMGHTINVEKTGVKVNCVCPHLTDTPLAHKSLALNRSLQEYVNSVYGGKMINPKVVAEGYIKLLEEDVTGEALVVSMDKGTFYMPHTDKTEV